MYNLYYIYEGHAEPPEYDAIIDVKCDTLGADPRASHKRDVNYDYAFVAEPRGPTSASPEQGTTASALAIAIQVYT